MAITNGNLASQQDVEEQVEAVDDVVRPLLLVHGDVDRRRHNQSQQRREEVQHRFRTHHFRWIIPLNVGLAVSVSFAGLASIVLKGVMGYAAVCVKRRCFIIIYPSPLLSAGARCGGCEGEVPGAGVPSVECWDTRAFSRSAFSTPAGKHRLGTSESGCKRRPT